MGACVTGTPEPQQVEFAELVADPEGYAGERVCTQGVHLSGFEVNALGAGTYTQGEAVYLSEPSIWLEGSEITSQGECLTVELLPGATFCPVQACGRFETGGDFGHLGGSDLLHTWTNPPLDRLEEEIQRFPPWLVWQALLAPELVLRHAGVEKIGESDYRVQMVVDNFGSLLLVTLCSH